jgi:preprotein translocase subunit SecE
MAEEVVQAKPSFIESTREYLQDIRAEMKRVTWPSRSRVESTTVVVILSVFLFALYFKIIDQILENTLVRVQSALVK